MMITGATAAYTYAFRGTDLTLDDYLASIETLPTLGIHHLLRKMPSSASVPRRLRARDAGLSVFHPCSSVA